MSTVQRHWLADVATRAGLEAARGLALDASADLDHAWATVSEATGVSVDDLAARIARQLRLRVANLSEADAAALTALPENIAQKYGAFPTKLTRRSLVVATANPLDVNAELALEFAAGRRVEMEVAPPDAVREAIQSRYAPDKLVEHLLDHLQDDDSTEVRVVEQFQSGEVGENEARVGPVVRLANVILHKAARRGASDVHIEPEEGGGRIRFRVDGVMEPFTRLPLPALVRIVSRIKVMASLDIADRVHPQDGNVRVQIGDSMYDLRVSTVPAQDAEKCVVRILAPQREFSLESLGYPQVESDRIRSLLRHRDGVLVMTGPTGSGKTTALYAALQALSAGELNISTVEDPIEYKLPGVTQVQIENKRGVTFASTLRALLRQDPDVIMVGEIRDRETADTAIRASMTGHLVLTTLHTNDAAGVVSRLADIGVDPANLASSLRGVVAQRLVRRLCEHCAAPVESRDQLTPRELRLIDLYGVEPTRRAVGCDRCRGSGFLGRLPVAEVMTVDDAIEARIAADASHLEIVHAAIRGGMRPLLEVALERVVHGETTLQEVERVGFQEVPEAERSAATPVRPAALAEAAPATRRRPPATAEPGPRPAVRPCIAVLPFVDLSGDEDNRYFSDGITDDIVVALSRIRSLKALSRSSVARYRELSPDLRDIAADLGVTAVLEGSVRRTGDQVRVAAQLFDVVSDEILWAETYDRGLDRIFAVQSEVARRIAAAMRAEFSVAEKERLEAQPTQDVRAYDFYLRGRHLWNRRTEECLRKGIDHFQRAVEIDPEFAPALAGLADSYVTLGLYGAEPTGEVMPLARDTAERALAVDPELAEALTSRGSVRALYDWDWEDAEADFLAAIDSNPGYGTAHHWYAINLLAPLRRYDEARAALAKALEVDPLSLVIRLTAGIVSFYERDPERVVEECAPVLELDAGFAVARYFLGQAYEQQGRLEEAITELEAAVSLSGRSSESVSALGYVRGVSGDEAGARALLAELRERSASRYVSPALLAQVHVALGETDTALDRLTEALAQRSAELIWLPVRPSMDVLRDEPRFRAILARIPVPA